MRAWIVGGLTVAFSLGCGSGEVEPTEPEPVVVPEADAPTAAPEAAPSASGPTLVSLQAGDVACYVELDENGTKRTEMAGFEICDKTDLIGKPVKFTTEKGNVMAASCQGDPECTATEEVNLINSLEAL